MMIEKENLEGYERRVAEFVGDAVYELIIREVLANDWRKRHSAFQKITWFRGNMVMGEIAKKIGIEPHCKNKEFASAKKYADALERKIYYIYKEDGIEAAKQYFIDNILPHYNT